MFTAVAPHPSAFRPAVPVGGESPRGSSSPRNAEVSQANGPPHKQRKRPPPLPTNTLKLTSGLLETYRRTNPAFVYVGAIQNPRRVLTKDARPIGNHGLDNKSSDLILTVGDVLSAANGGNKFRVLDMLGQGTFGQVVKCRAEWEPDRDESPPLGSSLGTSPASSGGDDVRMFRKTPPLPQMVAVKIVKNKPAYFNQAKVEIKVLHKVTEELGPGKNPGDPGHSLIRLLYDFEYHHHLCLVFELMSVNLYELIKHQDFRGLPFARVRAFCDQLLDALESLCKLGVIHCDLKPENILLENFGDPTSPRIKLIDLGSACYHDHVAFTYIQSRFYRAPEVLLGVKYSAPIDLWSLGCVAVELFMGLPVFPGVSAHNQLTRIVEMLGTPPNWMIEQGKKGETYFVPTNGASDKQPSGEMMMEFDMKEDYFTTGNQSQKWNKPLAENGDAVDEPSHKKHSSHGWMTSRYGIPPREDAARFRIKSPQEWAFENGLRDGPEKTKRYVKEKTLPGVVLKCEPKRRPKNEPVESLAQGDLECFIDFCSGLLRMDPNLRWTANQAMRHPFIKQAKYEGPFDPEISMEPELVPEENEEDLLFGGDLAADMAEMEMEVDDDEEEELEEERRRVRTRAAPLNISKSGVPVPGVPAAAAASSSLATSAGESGLTSASLTKKGLGLSSSQQRYKRKLSESNSIAASPQTTASSLTSVMGSPITRPDVPYPMAHQSRWSDLGVLASPRLHSVGLPYQHHSMLPPPAETLGSPAMSTSSSASRALSYGSSLPNQRPLFLQSHPPVTAQPAGEIHAFRKLEFQSGALASGVAAAGGGSANPYWGFTTNFSSLQMSPQQSRKMQPGGSPNSLSTQTLEAATLLSHMTSSLMGQPQQPQLTFSNPMDVSGAAQMTPGGAKLSSSWTSSSTLRLSLDDSESASESIAKKRSDSDHIFVVNALDLSGGNPASTGLSSVLSSPHGDTTNSVVVEKSLEKWAPFVKDQLEESSTKSNSTSSHNGAKD